MTLINETFTMIALFVLRLGVPVAVTILVTWGLRRLDARWQAEAEAQLASQGVAIGRFLPAELKAPLAKEKPCWTVRNCTESQRSCCAAAGDSSLPCWMARLRADGRLPGGCYGCILFRTRPRLEAIPV
jgi:hypothetical protein